MKAGDAVFGAVDDFDPDTIYTVKIRSMSKPAEAHVRRTGEGFEVEFLDYVKGAAPGQSAVVYYRDAVAASGIISGQEG